MSRLPPKPPFNNAKIDKWNGGDPEGEAIIAAMARGLPPGMMEFEYPPDQMEGTFPETDQEWIATGEDTDFFEGGETV
jgi:hypothetical protein